MKLKISSLLILTKNNSKNQNTFKEALVTQKNKMVSNNVIGLSMIVLSKSLLITAAIFVKMYVPLNVLTILFARHSIEIILTTILMIGQSSHQYLF